MDNEIEGRCSNAAYHHAKAIINDNFVKPANEWIIPHIREGEELTERQGDINGLYRYTFEKLIEEWKKTRQDAVCGRFAKRTYQKLVIDGTLKLYFLKGALEREAMGFFDILSIWVLDGSKTNTISVDGMSLWTSAVGSSWGWGLAKNPLVGGFFGALAGLGLFAGGILIGVAIEKLNGPELLQSL